MGDAVRFRSPVYAMELRVAQPLSDPARPVTVLIAEDEELVRELIARVLWAEGSARSRRATARRRCISPTWPGRISTW
jgi:hypothetical protein